MLAGSLFSWAVFYRVTADSFFVAEIARSLFYVLGHNIFGLPRYIASALDSAEPSVLFLISFAGILGFVLAVKLLRSIRSIMSFDGAATAASKGRT